MNEAETRADHIDAALKAPGRAVAEGSRIRREYPIMLGRLEGQGRRAKLLIADYLLIYRKTSLAVIEAKDWNEPLTSDVQQAKNCAGASCRFAFRSKSIPRRSTDVESRSNAKC